MKAGLKKQERAGPRTGTGWVGWMRIVVMGGGGAISAKKPEGANQASAHTKRKKEGGKRACVCAWVDCLSRRLLSPRT